MKPQPWRHFLAWILRGSVPTHDYIHAWAGDNLREEADRYKARHKEVQGRINALILEHTPVLYQPEKLTDGWESSHLEFKCAAPNCPYMWPCPSFAWARGESYLPVRVDLNDFVKKDEPR